MFVASDRVVVFLLPCGDFPQFVTCLGRVAGLGKAVDDLAVVLLGLRRIAARRQVALGGDAQHGGQAGLSVNRELASSVSACLAGGGVVLGSKAAEAAR